VAIWFSGSVKTTSIGWVWVSTTIPVVSPLEIWLPISTCFKPTRPSIGAVMRLQSSCSWALATAASSALIVPWFR
jgi:hypothetical protein